MKLLTAILLSGLMLGCGSKGDTFNSGDNNKIGGQESSDFYLDLAQTGAFGEQSILMAPRERVSRNVAFRPTLELRTNRTFIYRHVVTIYRNNSNQIIDRYRQRLAGTWSVDGPIIRLDGLGFGNGDFDFNGDRFLDLQITRRFRDLNVEGRTFRMTFN